MIKWRPFPLRKRILFEAGETGVVLLLVSPDGMGGTYEDAPPDDALADIANFA